MMWYSVEPSTKNYVKGYRFLSFARKCQKTIIGYRTICCKNCFQKVVHKAGEFIGNRIGDTLT